jgi:hypothetical protein
MPETFYGPWRIEFSQPYSTPYALQSLLISGSDNVDGRYALEYNEPIDITVLGEKWSLGVDVSGDPVNVTWQPVQPRKRLEVQPDVGLTTVLDIPFPNDVSGQSLAFQLICTCLDENINPPRKPNPFDFTYTREG